MCLCCHVGAAQVISVLASIVFSGMISTSHDHVFYHFGRHHQVRERFQTRSCASGLSCSPLPLLARVINFGQFRLRPAFFLRVRPIRLLPIEGWGLEEWRPRRVKTPKGGGPEGWRPRRVGPEVGPQKGPEGWGAQNFALCFPSPTAIFSHSSFSWGSFRVSGV